MRSMTLRTFAVAAAFAVAGAIIIGAISSHAFAATGGPTVTLTSTSAATTSGTSIPVTATFSESVTGFTSSDVAVTNATLSSFAASSTASTTVFTFNVNPVATGTVTVMVPADVASSTASSTGNQASNTLTFQSVASSTTPVISNISVSNIGTMTATIMWNTDTPATDQVFYGTTTSYGSSSALNTNASTTHTVNLSGLHEATLYHFAVQSTNGSSTATSADMTFSTMSTASTTPLAITGIDTNASTGIADNTFADGWQWTIHFTVPDVENAFRIRFGDWGNSSSSFPTANDIRIFSPESSNASTAGSGIVETGNGFSDWLYLTGDTSSTTPGRQIDLVVQVKIPFGTANGSYSSNFTAQTFPSTATSTATSTQ